MLKLLTKHFGEITYGDDEVITFPAGLPGFPEASRFVLLSGETPNALFHWLQCIDDSELAFTLVDIYQVMPDYDPQVEQEELKDLGDLAGSPLEVFNIAVIPEEISQMRVNLMAPLVINPVTRLGKQIIVSNEAYKIQHFIFEEIEKTQKKQN